MSYQVCFYHGEVTAWGCRACLRSALREEARESVDTAVTRFKATLVENLPAGQAALKDNRP